MSITISALFPDDIGEVLQLWSQTEGVGLNEGDDLDQLRSFLVRNPDLSLIARDGARLVGAVLCGHDGRRGHLYHLSVAPDYRGRGLGRRIVDLCLAGLAEQGIPKCNIFLYADNESGQQFWDRCGWLPRTDLKVLQRLIIPGEAAQKGESPGSSHEHHRL
jgi:ribosomal protein S18 acetylase RimI-like enzyme